MGVGDVEKIPCLAGKAAAGHGEAGGAYFRISGHGLIDHNGMHVFTAAGAGLCAHGTGDGAVRKGNGIFAFDNQSFGIMGCQKGVFHRDGGSGINGRRIIAAAFITAAGDLYGTAAPVGANGGRRIPRCGDGKVFGISGSTAGGLDTTGIICRGGDRGILTVTEVPLP